MAHVRPLAVERGRIMHVPELVQKLLVGHLRRVVRDLNGLRVTRASRAHLLVGRVVQGSTFVTRDGLDYPRHLVEKMLDTPEAAARESRFLHISLSKTLGPTRGQTSDT